MSCRLGERPSTDLPASTVVALGEDADTTDATIETCPLSPRALGLAGRVRLRPTQSGSASGITEQRNSPPHGTRSLLTDQTVDRSSALRRGRLIRSHDGRQALVRRV